MQGSEPPAFLQMFDGGMTVHCGRYGCSIVSVRLCTQVLACTCVCAYVCVCVRVRVCVCHTCTLYPPLYSLLSFIPESLSYSGRCGMECIFT